ncbi:hypothetical protein C8Q74DRAFT_1022428 [Fomes fomentarius]|nr:hypothetical protein C8Q74DRAFT_1022428 [Fomes fomentarius]
MRLRSAQPVLTETGISDEPSLGYRYHVTSLLVTYLNSCYSGHRCSNFMASFSFSDFKTIKDSQPATAHVMERALVQVQSLRDALKVTAALITKNSSARSEKSSPCLELVLNLADVLVAATADAVALQNSCVADSARDRSLLGDRICDSQSRNMQAALEDMLMITGMGDRGNGHLATMSDRFVLQVLNDVVDILDDNASSTAGLMEQQPIMLNMANPEFTVRTIKSLRRAVESHVSCRDEIEKSNEARAAAQRIADEAISEAKQLREELVAVRKELDTTKDDDTHKAASHQIAVSMLQAEISSQRDDNTRKIHERDAEIAKLKQAQVDLVRTLMKVQIELTEAQVKTTACDEERKRYYKLFQDASQELVKKTEIIHEQDNELAKLRQLTNVPDLPTIRPPSESTSGQSSTPASKRNADHLDERCPTT